MTQMFPIPVSSFLVRGLCLGVAEQFKPEEEASWGLVTLGHRIIFDLISPPLANVYTATYNPHLSIHPVILHLALLAFVEFF